MGRYFPFDDTGINFFGTTLVIKEMQNHANGIDGGGSGLNVWDGSLLLARYLERRPELVRNKSVLELGSGCGLVGLSSGIIGAYKVVMTDLKYALPLMLENVKRNESSWRGIDKGSKTIECKECDWFRPPPISELFSNNNGPDVILVADCVWLAPLIAPLLRTLETYTDDSTTVIITYQQRGKDAHEEFWEGIHHMFDVVAVDTETTVGLAKPDVFHVLECKKIST
ncbi:hypothetical protein ACHAW5_000780 [Stephanodiscus triporus]|uniref:Uncharacterized protein n=1 Tax=Stephanodiscus triporus TaxID=2934178 RepID=A0ABD3N1E6_9STRA